MKTTIKISGLRELEKAFAELPKATGKSVVRRVLVKRAQAVADHAKRIVPVDEGQLRDSIAVSTKRPKGHKTAAAQAFAKATAMGGDGKAAAKAAGSTPVEVFVGPGRMPQAHMQEFGTVNHPPQPYMRPAWDAEKGPLLDGLKADMWAEIKKSADRLAKKQARAAAKR